MTAVEAFEVITKSGAANFAQLVEACESLGPYCLIGSLAVNCYVEPIPTEDADIIVVTDRVPRLANLLEAPSPLKELRIRFTTLDPYQTFPRRAIVADVLDVRTRIACLDDVAKAALWAYSDPHRSLGRRQRDEADLIRIAESYPHVRSFYPRELLDQLHRR